MSPGLENLKHVVVLMMENRSFDHMFGFLKEQDSRIEGLSGDESNPDTTGAAIKVQPLAQYQSQLDPDPGHHYPDVDVQIFDGDQSSPRKPNMQGFITSYFQKQQDVSHSQKIMYCFPPEKLPVLTTLGRKYAIFNRWFSSIPGPTICNRAFAHFGTSFGRVGMDVFYENEPYLSIYERMVQNGHTAKIYYYDQQSSTMALTFLLRDQPKLFGTFDQFLADCKKGNLPQYSFIEPNYNDHDTDGGEALASDQHPDHDVQAGEAFIGSVYNAIRANKTLWESTALLIVYDEHGGLYDHVVPPVCPPDGFTDKDTRFAFDRLGVRVPAVLVSPWIPESTVVADRVLEHASIPATITEFFIGAYDQRSPREKAAATFLDILSLESPRTDSFFFSTSTDGAVPHVPGRPDANLIPIGKPQSTAMNKNRLISQLIYDQLVHLKEAEKTLPPKDQTGIDIETIKTEGQASDYIQKVTAKLHPPAAHEQEN
jgi:phospholipase C